MKNILYIIIGVVVFFNAYSQKQPFDIKSSTFEWEYIDPAKFLGVTDSTEECFIAYESAKLIVPHNFIDYSNPYSTSYFNYYLKKHFFIKYSTQNAIRNHSRFDLPLNFTNLHNSVYRDSVEFFENYQNKIDYSLENVGFRIWRNGEIVTAKVNQTIKSFIFKNIHAGYNSSNYYHYIYAIANLRPGDILEVQFFQKEYDMKKYYLNSILKIKKLHFEIDYFEPIYTKTVETELVIPKKFKPDSIVVKSKNHKLKKMVFNMDNPPLAKIEKGCHPQKDLDYFEYKILQFVMTEESNIHKLHDQNYKFHYRNYVTPQKTVKHLLNDTKTTYYRSLYKTLTGNPDALEIEKLITLHESLLDSFKYEYNNKNFVDNDKSVMYDYNSLVNNKLINHYFPYELWSKMFNQNNLRHYMTSLHDKRFNNLDYAQIKVMDERDCFSYIHENSPFYFIPRHSNYKYHSNELPFYYEGINVTLYPQNVPLDDYYKYNYDMPLFKTPLSTEAENYRKINYSGNVDVNSGKIDFSSKIILSGQFSTITRNFYIESLRDSMVNQRYYNPAYSLGTNTEVKNKELVSEEKSFPFKTVLKYDFTSKGILKKLSDSTVSFSMFNLLKHVYFPGIKGNRETNFYFDFKQTDTQIWTIHFDRKIELLEKTINNTITLKNGNYKFIITLQGESTLVIKSDLKITDEQFTPAEFNSVYELFHFFDDLENKSFTIKLI